MSGAWIFVFCLISDGNDCTNPEDYSTVQKWSYEACAEAQDDYLRDHAGENFVTFCKPDDKGFKT